MEPVICCAWSKDEKLNTRTIVVRAYLKRFSGCT
jgi:hypothetical protein